MKKFALILSGCGQHDGSETHEVILTLLSLAQEQIAWEAFAPDLMQRKIYNHLTQTLEEGQQRSVLQESARLVRGNIKPINEAEIENFDAVIFPGGVGAINILCNWADKNKEFEINPEISPFIDSTIKAKKPMGFICIAPIMIPKIYKSAKLTIGNDPDLAKQINEMGSYHVNCLASDIVIDKKNKVISTPANMVAKNINEVYLGINKLIKTLAIMD